MATSRPRAAMAEPEAMPADAIVHEMDTPESEEDACSWRALMETLAAVGDPPKRGSARSDDVTSEEPSIVAPFVSADAVPARWGLHVSGAVHGGWVKQTSPACAAAVVAGAWNALACGGDRHAPGALRQAHVVAHLEDVLSEAIAAKRARFERMLGAPIGDFMDALSAAIAVDPSGKTLGGVSKGEPGMKRPEVMRIVTELIASRGEAELAERESSMDPDHEHETLVDADEDPDGGAYPPGEPAPMSSFGALARLAREDAARRTADANDDADADAASADDEDEEPDEDIENDENADENGASSSINVSANSEPCEEDLIAALAAGVDLGGGGKKKKKLKKKFPTRPALSRAKDGADTEHVEVVWRWRRDLWEIIGKMAGLEKLRRPRPSTAAFGNWGVAEAFRRVSAAAAAAAAVDPDAPPAPSVTCRVAVGAKTKLRKDLALPLSRSYDPDVLEDEWAKFRSLFATDGSALVFHLKNHYSLIHALRERTDGDGTRVREMLCARRGQRPNAWISWEEARGTMLKWSGYAVMQATRGR